MSDLSTVRELLPDGYDLAREEDFIQAGQVLVEIGRKAFLALGELLAWKIARERAEDEPSRTRIVARYASAWGVSRSNLIKALVLCERFPDVDPPADASPTLAYEIVSGSETAEEAEAGMERATSEGWGAQDVREAKMLRAKGLSEGWERPYLFCRDGFIWARNGTGDEVWIAYLNPQLTVAAQAGVALLRYRSRV